MSSVCGSSGFGQKVRLNVVPCIDGQAAPEKFMVCIDGEASMKDLCSKVEAALRKHHVDGHLSHLTNVQRARLPDEEPVGDMLHDGEEVVAMLTVNPMELARKPEEPATVHDTAARATMAATAPGATPATAAAPAGLEPEPARPPAPEQLPASSEPEAPAAEGDVPGPCELPLSGDFTLGIQELNSSKTGGDWELEGLTPKLREYISVRFCEASAALDPSQSFISVSMRPRGGPAGTSSAVHYSIARIDIIDFERLCKGKIEEVRDRLDHFERRRQDLCAYVERGASADDYAPNMLPHRYKADEEFCSLLSEADSHAFGQVEGFRPLVLIDPSGTVAETWVFVRAALKRLLYSFMVTKSKFNLMKFMPHGRAAAWVCRMVPPSAQNLRDAEDWLDGVRPLRNSPDFATGLRAALASEEADVVYLLTGGLPSRCDADYVLGDIQAGNARGLPIHVIGVDCDPRAELDLRRLAEDNLGSFRQKRFAHGGAISGAGVVANGPNELRPSQSRGRVEHESMTIGGQVDILDIMTRESEGQLNSWLEEQRCAHRLLLMTATQQPVPLPGNMPAVPGTTGPRSHMRLQELLEAAHGKNHHAGAVPAAGGLLTSCRPASSRSASLRRDAAEPAQLLPPQGRRLQARAQARCCSASVGFRKPSLTNPWDASPTGPIRVSQLSARGPGARQRSLSARRGLRQAAVR
uniref:VWFA domain-containing protein n=1 Tax=Alexandrium monilatum TaxID=311494 RepID=A0A7S4SW56_9DINO